MGVLTESFGNLSEYLLAEQKNSKKRGDMVELVRSKLLQPLLPSAIRCGTGNITDIKDRHVGPLDLVASIDTFPPFSDGAASTYLADGVVFALQVRDWAENDLSHFGEMALQLKTLERKKKTPIPCLAVSFGVLPLPEVSHFLKSKAGQPIDGIYCVGHHFVLRNFQGWYGDLVRVPYVTATPGPESLKAFAFFLLHLSQSALNLPFGLADYQHL